MLSFVKKVTKYIFPLESTCHLAYQGKGFCHTQECVQEPGQQDKEQYIHVTLPKTNGIDRPNNDISENFEKLENTKLFENDPHKAKYNDGTATKDVFLDSSDLKRVFSFESELNEFDKTPNDPSHSICYKGTDNHVQWLHLSNELKVLNARIYRSLKYKAHFPFVKKNGYWTSNITPKQKRKEYTLFGSESFVFTDNCYQIQRQKEEEELEYMKRNHISRYPSEAAFIEKLDTESLREFLSWDPFFTCANIKSNVFLNNC